jgi:hypothetical protein
MCEDKWCGFGSSFFGEIAAAIVCGASCHFVGTPVADLSTQCRDQTDPGGPATAELAVSGSAVVTVKDTSATATATGVIRYALPQDCTASSCPIMFVTVELTIPDFDLDGTTVNARLQSGNNAVGTWQPSDASYHFAAGDFLIGANFNLDGDHGSVQLANDQELFGTLDPSTDTFSFSGTFTVDDVTVNITSLNGTHTNRPPVAVIQPTGTLECNTSSAANVTFDASQSSDPDGNIDRYEWSFAGELFASTSPTHTTTLPLGSTDVGLLVHDAAGGIDDDQTTVVVADTTAPTLAAPPDVFREACDTAGAVVAPGAPVVLDACDPNPAVTARVVEINEVPADQPLVSGYTFKQGVTVIEYSATDFSGHTTTTYQHVTLDFGVSCCPAGLQVITGSAGNDAISGGNNRQCIAGLAGDDILAGDNNADVLFGGLGNDHLDGGNQDDLIRGGVGDDTIIAGTGGDGNSIWGGPGEDTILGANGQDTIRGGAGADAMYGGNGNDTFIIAADCEALPGEIIDGGGGTDTLRTPVPLSTLQAAGVTIQNVEIVVVTPTLADAECVDP